ncbi:MAG: hypothetical protein ABIH75_01655 [Candidatus Omnitrophota bacterium]
MEKKLKLIIIIGLAVILAVSIFIILQTYSAKKALEQERDGLRSENTVLSRKIDEIAAERKQLEGKANALSNDLTKAYQEKDDIQKQYNLTAKERDGLADTSKFWQENAKKLRVDLANITDEKRKLEGNLASDLSPLKEENDKLKKELDDLKSVKGKLEAELWQFIGKNSDFEDKLSQIDSFLRQRLSQAEYATLKAQINGIISSGIPGAQGAAPAEESIELPPIVVKPRAEAETPLGWLAKKRVSGNPTGTILDVNRENGFVIIDLGQDAGTKVGDIFKVYKEGNPIAALQVIQVRQNISACDIKEESTPIKPGDIVR